MVATGRKNFVAKSAVLSAMPKQGADRSFGDGHTELGSNRHSFHPTPVALRLKCHRSLEDLSPGLHTGYPFAGFLISETECHLAEIDLNLSHRPFTD